MIGKLISAFLAFLSVYAVGSSLHLYTGNSLSLNVLSIPLFLLLYQLFVHTGRKWKYYMLSGKILTFFCCRISVILSGLRQDAFAE